MIRLDEIIDEMLSFEKKEVKKTTFFERIHNFKYRKEIEKSIQDEINSENQRLIKLGDDAQKLLSSSWYRDLIEPYLRNTIKGGIQSIIREGEGMTEIQLKCQIATIKKALELIGSIKLKILQSEEIKAKNG